MGEMVAFTNRFADDMAFVPNHVKSRRFSTDPVIRAAVRAVPGPEVAMTFLDLGVAQTLVNRPSPFQGKRVSAGLGKLWRTSVLSLSLKRRCHFVAASGIPASMYGQRPPRSATACSTHFSPPPWPRFGGQPRGVLAS